MGVRGERAVRTACLSALQERSSKLEGEIKKVTAQIELLSSELLPFCLVPELCQKLGRRLLHEARLHLRRTTEGLWNERVDKFQEALQREKVWAGLELSDKSRKTLVNRLVRALRATVGADANEQERFIHNLAEPEQDRLHNWISQTFQAVPRQIVGLCDELRALQTEQRQTEVELQRAPEDDVLAPIHAEILQLQETLRDVQKQQSAIQEQTGALQN